MTQAHGLHSVGLSACKLEQNRVTCLSMVTQRSETTDKPSVKVHRLYIPTDQNREWYLIILAAGIVFSWIFAYVLLIVPILTFLDIDDELPRWAYMTAIIGAFAGPILWVIGYSRFRHRRLMKKPFQRTERLKRLVLQSDTFVRLPHRVIEYLLRNRKSTPKKLQLLFQRIPSNSICIIEDHGNDTLGSLRVSSVSFEPVDITIDTKFIQDLIDLHSETETSGDNSNKEHSTTSYNPISSTLVKVRNIIISSTAAIVGYVSIIYNLIIHQNVGLTVIILAVTLATSGYTYTLIINRRWWLVPGGLIYREDFAWRKGMRCSLITPDQSPLILDWRTGIGMVVDGGKVRKFSMGEHARWLVAAGWISQARTPTLEEVQSFLGMDKE